jgi:hypothetical protein
MVLRRHAKKVFNKMENGIKMALKGGLKRENGF